MLDMLIKNGKIVDGTGNPWYWGSVGIKDGIIVKTGHVHEEAVEAVDAGGNVISPGFIDVHTHGDIVYLARPVNDIKIRQGITTEVFGNCGISAAPVSSSYAGLWQTYAEPVIGRGKGRLPWNSFNDFIDEISRQELPVNVAALVGSGALRTAVKGFDPGTVGPEEMAAIKKLLGEALEAGALGLSLGLIYMPDIYYTTDELTGICTTVSAKKGLVTVHLRGEGNSLTSSVREMTEIVRKTGISLHISHFKAMGRKNWGILVKSAMEMIEDARTEGLDITCDVYPYNAGCTTIMSLLPAWALDGGAEKTLVAINNPQMRKKLRDDLQREHNGWDNLVVSIGWDNIIISSVQRREDSCLIGKSISEIAGIRGRTAVDCALDIIAENDTKVGIVLFGMSEEDVGEIITWKNSMIASDSIYSENGLPHPRLYGTFPRLFARYVREQKTLSLEQAVRKVTSFPAQRFGLNKRGLLLSGYAADVTVFDPDRINDRADFNSPRQYPDGIEHVIVGGRKAVKSGQYTGVANGVFIKSLK